MIKTAVLRASRLELHAARLMFFLLLAPLPAGAATVEVHKKVRDKTPAALGIPAQGVPTRGVRAHEVDRAAIKRRAAAVFEKNPVAAKGRGRPAEETEDDRAVKFKSGSIQFEVSKAAGAEILLDLDRYTRPDPRSTRYDDKAVERRAREYIRSNMPDVDPGEIHFVRTKKIMDSVAKVANDGKLSEVRSGVANSIAIFQRRIQGVPVVGPGEKIRVYLSSSGEVIGHSKIWREVDKTPGPSKPVVPPGRIQDTVVKKLATHPARRVEVDFFEFGYLGEGRYTAQDELRPVYLVGYRAGPETKRVIEIYDAYTGAEIPPPPDPAGEEKKGGRTGG